MKRIMIYTLLLSGLGFLSSPVHSQQYIADYTIARETVLRSIPTYYIDKAREELVIAYQHTSHGTHVSRGMYGLPDYKAGDNTLFGISIHDKEAGKLFFMDYALEDYPPGAEDLSVGEETFVETTRNFLDAAENAAVNVVMWSWCDISDHDVSGNYLPGMETLIAEYGPGGSRIGTGDGQREVPVTFVFMTGHATTDHNVGEGRPKDQAQLIIDHCIANNRLCLDYYSIDTHDMDDNYWEDTGDDGNSEAYGGNFYQDWQDAHSVGDDYYENRLSPGGEVAYGTHTTQHITSNRKAYAMWWILARIAGWNDDTATAMVPVAQIEVCSADSIVELKEGDTLRFFAEVFPDDATYKEITWSVRNGSGTATISDDGLLTAVSQGNVTILASAHDSSGVSGSFSLNIEPREESALVEVEHISISTPENVTVVEAGQSLQLMASISPPEASNPGVFWHVSSDGEGEGLGSVTEDGLFIALVEGRVEVVALAQDGSGVYDMITLTVLGPSSRDESESEPVLLYPNPGKDLFFLNVGDLKVEQIQLIDLHGSKVLEQNPEPGNHLIELDLSRQEPGIYFVRLLIDRDTIVNTVIISR